MKNRFITLYRADTGTAICVRAKHVQRFSDATPIADKPAGAFIYQKGIPNSLLVQETTEQIEAKLRAAGWWAA